MGSVRSPIPITVIGGYLGAGKTTLLNSMLRRAGGRRLGIVVNDFGDLAVDAGTLGSDPSDAGRPTPIVNLANGCVCCTLGDDLRATLAQLASIEPALDQIVIEASGVADPATAAAWGTVPGFVPGGVVVAAAADSVMRSARDRYVGGEVRRQLHGADLVIVTKADLCGAAHAARVIEWIGTQTDAPTVVAQRGEIGLDVVLGIPVRQVDAVPSDAHAHVPGEDGYVRWSVATGVVESDHLDEFLAVLPDGVLRMKGVVDVRAGTGTIVARLVQVVGRTAVVTEAIGTEGERGLEAIGIAGVLDVASLEARAEEYLRG